MCFLLPNSESVWFHFVVIINQLLGLSYTIRHKSSWRCLLLVHSACADHCSTIPIPVRTHQRTADFTTTTSGVNDRQVYVITGEIKLLSDVLNRQDCFFSTCHNIRAVCIIFLRVRSGTCTDVRQVRSNLSLSAPCHSRTFISHNVRMPQLA